MVLGDAEEVPGVAVRSIDQVEGAGQVLDLLDDPGGIAGYVFGGVMAGISFFLLNNVFGYIGNLQNWQPWLTAALPGMIYLLLSLTAFVWLVLRR